MPQDFALTARIAYLQWLAEEDAAEEQQVRTLREYASGEHPTYLTDRQKEFLGLKSKDPDHLFAHNLCGLVIDSVVERLAVEEFAPADETVKAPELVKAVAGWWEGNRMDALQDQVYGAACRDAAAYVIVDWDPVEGRPRWTLNLKSDGTQGIKVYRDPNSGQVLYAAKRWQAYDLVDPSYNGRTRVTLYFPDRVEKYISAEKANPGLGGLRWEPFRDAPGEPWPIPWTDGQERPLGLAVVEFPNPGGSEIDQALPLQDMLNKSDLDLVAAADSAGFRILWASGIVKEYDADGTEKAVTVGPGQMLKMTDPNAKLGAVEAADPASLIKTCKYWVEATAGVTRTPQYLFQALGGDQPSGESLKEQEVGLEYKVERRQRLFGNAWEDVIYLSRKLHNLYRPGEALDEAVRLQAQWKSAKIVIDQATEDKQTAETRQINASAALVEQQVGVSQQSLIESLGYDPEVEKTQRGADSAELGEQVLTAFDQGR